MELELLRSYHSVLQGCTVDKTAKADAGLHGRHVDHKHNVQLMMMPVRLMTEWVHNLVNLLLSTVIA